jgi:hypothetical protein
MMRLKYRFLLAALLGLSAVAIAAAGNLMSVQIKKGYLRSAPSFLGKAVAALDYAEQVSVLEKREAWLKVRASASGAEGWLHASALTARKIILKPGTGDVAQSASSDELALAGKGFNRQVEGEFKAKNPQIDYTWINRMEQALVSEADMERFLQEGGLSPNGVLK